MVDGTVGQKKSLDVRNSTIEGFRQYKELYNRTQWENAFKQGQYLIQPESEIFNVCVISITGKKKIE